MTEVDDWFDNMSRSLGLHIDDIRNEINNRMSLRDWFAGQVISSGIKFIYPEDVAKIAYELADAMLKERSKGALK